MYQTYQNASVLLVLDASLDSRSIELSLQERLLRIRVSPWMQRLWTLQEAWVARELAFQSAERAFWASTTFGESVTQPNPTKLQVNLLRDAQWNTTNFNRLIRALAVDYESFQLPTDMMLTLRRTIEQEIPGFLKDEDIWLSNLINQGWPIDSVSRNSAIVLLDLLENHGWISKTTDGALVSLISKMIRSALTDS
jgi:hypothetical protein